MFLESRRERSAGGFSLDDAAITRELMSMSNDLNSPFYPATTYSFARPVSASNPDFSAWNTTGRGTSVFGGDMSLLRHNRGSRCADRGLPHDFRADGAKPFAGWRGLHDTRPFFLACNTLPSITRSTWTLQSICNHRNPFAVQTQYFIPTVQAQHLTSIVPRTTAEPTEQETMRLVQNQDTLRPCHPLCPPAQVFHTAYLGLIPTQCRFHAYIYGQARS